MLQSDWSRASRQAKCGSLIGYGPGKSTMYYTTDSLQIISDQEELDKAAQCYRFSLY